LHGLFIYNAIGERAVIKKVFIQAFRFFQYVFRFLFFGNILDSAQRPC
jgi:hypothetical protein